MNRFGRSLTAVAAVTLALAAFTAGDVALRHIAPAAAQAAPSGPPGGAAAGGRARFGKMLLSLNLTDEQKSRIKAIMASARAKSKALTDMQAKRAAMRGAFKDVEAVLTPAQKTKLDAERAAARAQGGNGADHS